MPKDNLQDDIIFNDPDIDSDDIETPTSDDEDAEPEIDNLSDDVKDALGLDEDGEEKPKQKIVKGKKPSNEVTPISDWLPEDDAKAMQSFNDSLW